MSIFVDLDLEEDAIFLKIRGRFDYRLLREHGAQPEATFISLIGRRKLVFVGSARYVSVMCRMPSF